MNRLAARLTAGLAASLLALSAAPARGTTVLDLPLPAMAQRAQLVVRGSVTAQKVEWDVNGKIVTRTFVRVARTLKGAAPRDVVVRQPGGELDGMKMAVSGTARFEVGEDVVLFLEASEPVAGEYVLLTMGGGKFAVKKSSQGTVLERSTTGLTFARKGADGLLAPSGEGPSTAPQVKYDEFLRQVQAAPAPKTP